MVMERLPRFDSLERITEAGRADGSALLSILKATSDKVWFTKEFRTRAEVAFTDLNARATRLYENNAYVLMRWNSVMCMVHEKFKEIDRILALKHMDDSECTAAATAMGFINACRATYERTLGTEESSLNDLL